MSENLNQALDPANNRNQRHKGNNVLVTSNLSFLRLCKDESPFNVLQYLEIKDLHDLLYTYLWIVRRINQTEIRERCLKCIYIYWLRMNGGHKSWKFNRNTQRNTLWYINCLKSLNPCMQILWLVISSLVRAHLILITKTNQCKNTIFTFLFVLLYLLNQVYPMNTLETLFYQIQLIRSHQI